MWYWLDGLVNSRLIEAGLLTAVRVAGFLLGVMIAAARAQAGFRPLRLDFDGVHRGAVHQGAHHPV